MSNRHLVFSGVLLGLLALSACATTREGPLRLYQFNDGDLVSVEVGETFEVFLEGDPTTTVNWIRPPSDEGLLEQVGTTEYVTDLSRPDGRERLRLQFRGLQKGRTRLQLTYPHPDVAAREVQFELWVVIAPREKV